MNANAIYEKLVAVTKTIATEGIGKTRKNTTQGYNFRGVDEVMNAFSPILAAHGLFIRPRFTERDCAERQSKNGGVLFYVTVKGEFDFVDGEGGSVTVGPFYGEAMDSGDKATNKAMAVAFKYAMFQTFCVPLEGVTGGDADAEHHEILATDWITAVDSCASKEELDKLAAEIKAANLPNATAAKVRAAWAARASLFREAA